MIQWLLYYYLASYWEQDLWPLVPPHQSNLIYIYLTICISFSIYYVVCLLVCLLFFLLLFIVACLLFIYKERKGNGGLKHSRKCSNMLYWMNLRKANKLYRRETWASSTTTTHLRFDSASLAAPASFREAVWALSFNSKTSLPSLNFLFSESVILFSLCGRKQSERLYYNLKWFIPKSHTTLSDGYELY